MRGLPKVSAVGYVGQDAIYKKINEKGGFLSFSMYCFREDARDGDPNPSCWYNVTMWIKDESRLPAVLVKSKTIAVYGDWEVNKTPDGKYYNRLVADRIQIIGPKDAPSPT